MTRIIGMEPEDGTWRERRAQVLVDLKQFQAAIEDFDAAESLYDKDYKSLGLLSNRALAREGLSDWSGAVRDYTECINLSREIGGVPPYVLNSRGNALSSLGRYDEALGDYEEAAKTFQVMHNLSGAIYARSNAALTLAELGRDEEAMREMEAVARRAAGSIDMRAALAAMLEQGRGGRGGAGLELGLREDQLGGSHGGRSRAGRLRPVSRQRLAREDPAVAAVDGEQDGRLYPAQETEQRVSERRVDETR